LGADADITIYLPDEDYQQMFELPRYVICRGEVIVDNGEVRQEVEGRTLHVDPAYDVAAMDDIQEWFEQFYTIQFRNYPVGAHYLRNPLEIPTHPT
jgi:formylmethanofuran dehydrogenase subunit A